jgi:hypothetical protein
LSRADRAVPRALDGTPNASRPGVPSPCDFVTIRYSRRKRSTDGYRLVEQGLGCSRARRIARRLSASPGCAALTAPGHACTVGGVRCEVIAGGAWRRLAGRRCAIPDDPARATELVHQQPCLPPDAAGDFIVWVINLDCRTARAFPFNDQVDCPVEHDFRPQPCASHAGFTCTVRYIAVGAGDGEEGRCVEDRTGYRAFEYFQGYGL